MIRTMIIIMMTIIIMIVCGQRDVFVHVFWFDIWCRVPVDDCCVVRAVAVVMIMIIIIIITIITIMVVVAYQHRLGKRTLLLNNRFTTCCTFGGLRWVIIAHIRFFCHANNVTYPHILIYTFMYRLCCLILSDNLWICKRLSKFGRPHCEANMRASMDPCPGLRNWNFVPPSPSPNHLGAVPYPTVVTVTVDIYIAVDNESTLAGSSTT